MAPARAQIRARAGRPPTRPAGRRNRAADITPNPDHEHHAAPDRQPEQFLELLLAHVRPVVVAGASAAAAEI
ncbi:hypothetical protein ACIBG6_39075 [Streptomyces sp. NPDC050842]|uniref:hypothetical protein n=1 Tax=Streptomyces sp. NPDC050842 TaxID=3365636 RepID=UPI003791964F